MAEYCRGAIEKRFEQNQLGEKQKGNTLHRKHLKVINLEFEKSEKATVDLMDQIAGVIEMISEFRYVNVTRTNIYILILNFNKEAGYARP